MITEDEVKAIAMTQGIPLPVVEKDYVMSWLLWGIYKNPSLAGNLILKGGNCLRKIYFSDTRFSDDLDFTAYSLDQAQIFQHQLVSVCHEISRETGIEFVFEKINVKEKTTPDPDSKALDGRVYFKGFAGDSSITMKIKFDVSEYEKIVLPVQQHMLIHSYSDTKLCQCTIMTYSLEEVLAEKLRSWIQRTRSRDLFDVVKIIQSRAVPISTRNILSAFLQKTIFKSIPMAAREELLYEEKFQRIEQDWQKTIVCPLPSNVLAVDAIQIFREFIDALYEPDILASLGLSVENRSISRYNVRSGIREAIIEAGKSRQLMRMRYKNKDRDIEPYSFRFKVTKEGHGAEYFYGFDRTRGNTIKGFFLFEIQAISIQPQNYIPRWRVEF
jgi:predicted nucleotidyltransferase component of viral defense system